MTKKELRKLFLEKRKGLSEAEWHQLNLALYSVFFSSIDLSFVRILHLFLPLAANREPDTMTILDRVRREFPGVRVVLPRVAGNDLEHIFYEGPHQLELSSWGIPEPKQGVPASLETMDMVLVPLVAFDQHGHRVGYGKGFYDRFLAKVRPDCQRIGLSLFPAVNKITDIDERDTPLTQCVTPEGTIVFK